MTGHHARRLALLGLLPLLALLPLLPWGGCASLDSPESSSNADTAYWEDTKSAAAPDSGRGGFGGDAGGGMDRFASVELDDAVAAGEAARSLEASVVADGDAGTRATAAVEGRKLIRTGSISVIVDDYAPFEQALDEQLAQLGGFVADASLDHWSGRVSYATLTVRVPSARFDDLVGWTESQVEVQSLNVNTQDVTEEWVDVRSRIDNGKRTEARLQEILRDRTATLADILAVEQELARVRGEIERAEGRMRVLGDQVELATLTISVSVRNPYEPAVEPPGFGAQIVDAFSRSIEAMVTLGKGLVILGVALSPWLAVMAVVLGTLLLVIRALVRRRRRRA